MHRKAGRALDDADFESHQREHEAMQEAIPDSLDPETERRWAEKESAAELEGYVKSSFTDQIRDAVAESLIVSRDSVAWGDFKLGAIQLGDKLEIEMRRTDEGGYFGLPETVSAESGAALRLEIARRLIEQFLRDAADNKAWAPKGGDSVDIDDVPF